MILEPSSLTPLEWVSQHIQLIGWPTLIYATWRVTRFFTIVETRVLSAEEHVTKMATNCFPTMQASLQTQDALMKSMDSSLKTLANGRKSDDRTPRRIKRK